MISVVIVSHNQWDLYTKPLIESIRKYHPNIPIVVVDNGSDPPNPTDMNVISVRLDNESLSKALNIGLLHCPVSDWYLLLNNDTIVAGYIDEIIKGLSDDTLYCGEIRNWGYGEYANGWCTLIPYKILISVGMFDENYKQFFYEDVDYSYRLLEKGWKIEKTNLPISHIDGGGNSRKYVKDIKNLHDKRRAQFLNKFGLKETRNV